MTSRYQINRQIGQGGLGAVFAATDTMLGREIALKRVSAGVGTDPATLWSSLLKEAKSLSALQHPNVVTVYDVGQDAEGPFLIMELVKGETLDATIARGVLTFEDFSGVVKQSLEGMMAAHAIGMVHRDLKPGNLMLNWLPSGKFQLKILDFGLAKLVGAPSSEELQKGEGIFGSIYFMAPEQFDRATIDERTDLYSLGAIFYFTLTGRYPFQGDNAAQVMASHFTRRFVPLDQLRPDLQPWVVQWVHWLMSRKPEDRPASVSEALKAFQEQRGHAPAPSPVQAKVAIPSSVQPSISIPSPAASSKPQVKPVVSVPKAAVSVPSPPATPSPVAPRVSVPVTPSPQRATVPAVPQVKPAVAVAKTSQPLPGVVSVPKVSPTQNSGTAPVTLATPLAPPGSGRQTVRLESAAVSVTPDVQVAEVEDAYQVEEEIVYEVHEEKRPKEPLIPVWALVSGSILLVIILLAFGLRYTYLSRQQAVYDRFTFLAESQDITGTPDDVRMLKDFVLDPKQEINSTAGIILSRLQGGEDVQKAIQQLYTELPNGPAKLMLVRVLGMRGDHAAVPLLLKEVQSSDDKIRLASWYALGATAKLDDLSSMLDLLTKVDRKESQAAEYAITSVANEIQRPELRVQAVVSALENAKTVGERTVLLNLLAKLGGDAAWKVFQKYLDSSDDVMRLASINALQSWSTSQPVVSLAKIFKDTPKNPEQAPLRYAVINTIARLCDRPGSLSLDRLAEEVIGCYEDAQNDNERQTALSALAMIPHDSVVSFLEGLDSTDLSNSMKDYAKSMIPHLKTLLEKVLVLDDEGRLTFEKAEVVGPEKNNGVIDRWIQVDEFVFWIIQVPEAGRYTLSLNHAVNSAKPGTLEIIASDVPERVVLKRTGDDLTQLAEGSYGDVRFESAGTYRLVLRSAVIPEGESEEFMRLGGGKLTRK